MALLAETASERRRGCFSYTPFVVLWAASSLSLTGIAISDAASAWLMTTIDADPRAVSFVLTASSLPMFLFTLVAGTLADMVQPRRFLIALESAVVILMASFAAAVQYKLVTPPILLVVIFTLSTCWSLASPAWMSLTPLLVPRENLEGANAANSVGYNVSRSVGPAICGVAIATLGGAAPYWMFAATNTLSVISLIWWTPPKVAARNESLSRAIVAGIKCSLGDRAFRHTLYRTVAVYPFAAAYLALLPLLARSLSSQGPQTYGFLLALVSAGAVLGAFALQPLRARGSPDFVVAIGTVALALGLALLAIANDFWLAGVAAVVVGAAWTVILSVLYVSVQIALSDDVRGRGLGVFLTVVFGSVTLGSTIWGQIAAREGLPAAFLVASGVALVATPLVRRWKLLGAGG